MCIRDRYHAFSERIFREVPLRPLGRETLRTLIQEHLSLHRTEPTRGPDPTYPFTEEAIDHILQASQGNVRRALALCNMAIDAGVKQGDEWITPETIQRMSG